jgi:VanZ family protein
MRLFFLFLPAMKLKIVQFIPAVIWFIIANILFLMPGPDVPSVPFLEKIYFDKWVHAGIFFWLVVLTAYPFMKVGRATKKLLIKISIAFVFYGVLIEFLQKYVAFERDYDVNDMIADAVGCALGFVAANWLAQRITAKNKLL